METVSIGALLMALAMITAGWLLVTLVLGTIMLWGGAKMAGIRNVTFVRALFACAVGAVASWAAGVVVGVVPCIGWMLSGPASLAASLLVIREVFDTSWGKAVLAWVLFVIAKIAAMVVVWMVMAGADATLMGALGG